MPRTYALALPLVALLLHLGCTPAPAPDPDEGTGAAVSTGPVRLAVVDDPPLAAAIEREWKARAEGELQVARISASEATARVEADVIVFPTELLGVLAEARAISPLPETALNDPRLAAGDWLDLTRRVEATWGQRLYAAPLGTTQLTLLYRADLFEQRGLSPPSTWPEYQQLAEQFATQPDAPPSEPASEEAARGRWSAVAEPLAPGWRGLTLLARAAPYAKAAGSYSQTLQYRTMEPLIDTPPYVRALEELVAAAKLGPPDALELTPADALERLLDGRTAMALAWPAPSRSATEPAVAAGMIAAAELPGSPEVYQFQDRSWTRRGEDDAQRVPLVAIAGRLVAIGGAAREREGALNVLLHLSSREWSSQISAAAGASGPFRRSQLGELSAWLPLGAEVGTARTLRDTIEARQRGGAFFMPPRIPGREQYLAALDEGVRKALAGEAAPQAALSEVADAWRAITAERGLEPQRAAYLRCLGLEP